MSEVVYLYGFVPSDAPQPPPGLEGVGGRPVELLPAGAFRAAISLLPGDEYAEADVNARLGDLGWVAAHGVPHEHVVTWLADHAPIVPARMLTLFSSPAALLAAAAEQSDVVAGDLERFRTLREWDLKVSYDRDALSRHLGAVSPEIARLDEEIVTAPPGRRYLLERKRDELAWDGCAAAAARVARGLLADLARMAEETTELAIPTTDRALPVVLNAALLVAVDKAGEVERAAAATSEAWAGRGLDVALTGPWAPYRFVREGHGA